MAKIKQVIKYFGDESFGGLAITSVFILEVVWRLLRYEGRAFKKLELEVCSISDGIKPIRETENLLVVVDDSFDFHS
jgi:hypothetical protein